ncbi:T9SS type A sorting domain-containing protein [Flavobacterium sp. AS60]|uniref:T9SS type A sorting domain-containing protein n=1 Tax=Flavobacterium anseongense TaxID=2910677 RepID=UPI001F182A27|nr:T9SS type A sorting domain-containing protein [Flavobacterium sp. AS60]MCF6129946.1 T9SS type A sorting domain-containing protein [Flavobacterium sp. AS60]
MKQKYILFMLFSLFVFKGNAQSNYAVNSIPFQPFSGTLSSLTTADDIYSPVITMPFSFDFYGVTYNQIIVSTNGYIDFRTNLAGQYSPWTITYQIPWTNFPAKSSIFGCYEDLNNNAALGGLGTITCGSYGTAPYRKFVVYFYNQPHFQCNSTIPLTSFQMILSETTNIIDVQIINRTPCMAWRSGEGVIGIINSDGTQGITPPGRNTGNWSASNEAWRFYRPGYYPSYSFVRCDDDSDSFVTFDLTVAANDLSPANPSAITFFEDNALTIPVANPTAYINTSNPRTIYASGNGAIRPVVLNVIDCSVDTDSDSVPSATEDVNNDTNLANDDTDLDGIPNYLDNDDDGDLVLTSVEYVFARDPRQVNVILDTDLDGIPNYLDSDDDGDGLLTWREDYNNDGNPANDDTNSSGTPDYLESSVALGLTPVSMDNNSIKVFPNPATNVLNIQNNNDDTNASIEIYSISGAKVKALKATQSLTTISVSDLQSGVYFVKVTMNNQVGNYKFIKN